MPERLFRRGSPCRVRRPLGGGTALGASGRKPMAFGGPNPPVTDRAAHEGTREVPPVAGHTSPLPSSTASTELFGSARHETARVDIKHH